MKKLIFLSALLSSSFIAAQSIYKSSIDSGGASVNTGGIELLYTIGEVNLQEKTVGNINISEGFINVELDININPKIFLQGPLLNPSVAGLMNDNLRALAYLPIMSPYGDNAIVSASVFDLGGTSGVGLPQDDIVDWVWVELRNANTNTLVVREQSALLQRDGDIVDLDGVSNLHINAAQSNYFVVIKHRNHLGAMSLVTIGLSQSPQLVDFTNNSFSTYGSHAQVQMSSGAMALRTGDAGQNGQIRFSGSLNDPNVIKDYVLSDPSNGFNTVTFSSSGYLNIDVNMDGNGKFSGAGNDSNIVKDNVLSHPGNSFNTPTYTINITVPEN